MEGISKHLPADERRAVTVDTVIELAAEQNPSDITTTAIARRMRLTQGALFRHFPTKDAIWEAVMQRVAEHVLGFVDNAKKSERSALAALEAIYTAHIDFVVRHPGVPRMLFGELQRPGESPAKRIVEALTGRYAERLRAVIRQGKATGELAADVDPTAAATLFIGMIQGLVMQSLLAGDPKRIRRDAPGVFAIFREGITA